jgi:hypothetical protein
MFVEQIGKAHVATQHIHDLWREISILNTEASASAALEEAPSARRLINPRRWIRPDAPAVLPATPIASVWRPLG